MRKPLKPNAAFSEAEKARVTGACERLIDDFLKPRFLPSIQPTEFNYPVDILGKWHGAKYRLIQRYRSGFPDNLGEEFDALIISATKYGLFVELADDAALVELAAGTPPLLFLLDEILAGTNSHDRRIGAEAVVRALVQAGADIQYVEKVSHSLEDAYLKLVNAKGAASQM